MGKKRKTLSQEEIWDDSALIQSWDDALEEYKLYHSIHARGERVEDVLRAAEAEKSSDDGETSIGENITNPENGINQENLEDGELEDQVEVPVSNQPIIQKHPQSSSPAEIQVPPKPSDTHGIGSAQGVSHLQQEIISASSKDEALKNLMMSWYWAGYYTGYYEGQTEAKPSAHQEQNGQQ